MFGIPTIVPPRRIGLLLGCVDPTRRLPAPCSSWTRRASICSPAVPASIWLAACSTSARASAIETLQTWRCARMTRIDAVR